MSFMEYNDYNVSGDNITDTGDQGGSLNVNEDEVLKNIVGYANRYFLPFIIVTGFIGNAMSFMVFICSRLKKISTSVYLAALSVSDAGFLFCVGLGWLDAMGIHFFHKNGICQIVVYMTFVFSFTSVWYVNAFTTEMYIAVFHSSVGAKICTPSCARKIVGGLTGFAGLFYLFAFWTTKVASNGVEDKCTSNPRETSVMVLTIVDTFLTLLLPFTMIIFMTTRLLIDISRLYKSAKDEHLNGVSTQSASESMNESQAESESAVPTEHSSKQALKAQAKLKQMLVVVVIVFIVLNLPSHAIRVQSFFRSSPTTRTEFYWQHIVQILYYINFAVNFVLYSACGRSFRKALLQLPIISCLDNCNCSKICNGFMKDKLRSRKLSDIKHQREENNHNSRLVEIHLSEIHFSQLPSMDSEFVYQSPPCLLSPTTK